MQLRKIYINRDIIVKDNARKKAASRASLTVFTFKKLSSFLHLQKLFSSSFILIHFDEKRILYIDLNASKEFNLVAHVYYDVDEKTRKLNEEFKQKTKQLILFLSRLLSDVETRY